MAPKLEAGPGARIRRRKAVADRGPLPSTVDQAKRSSNRLAALAGVGLLLAGWYTLQLTFGPPLVGGVSPAILRATLVGVVACGILSGVVFVVARWMSLTQRDVFRLGFGYLVVISFTAALSRHVVPWGDEFRGVSAQSLLVLLFPVLVPCPPRQAALVGTSALGASLLAWGITVALGNPLLSPVLALRVFAGEILAIPLGLLVADVVHHLGQKLEEERRLGSYELVERLGIGGMGEVWRARHATLARPAAVKLVRPDALLVSDLNRREALLGRFEREALVTASLASPHTVEVYDFGIEEDGTFFYVMELLDGIDLHEMVARFGTLPPERAVWFLRQACRSLAEAHDRGLVHRDVKPSNLIACRRGDDVDFLKVVDFGLVTPLSQDSIDERFTRMGQAPGTPAYMAPEQAKNPQKVDGRADLYSLGCVAFWLLTRSHVFDGPTQFEIHRKHSEEPAPPPSSRSMYPIPPELDALVLKCLEKDPNKRPRNARVLLGMLGAVPLAEPWTEERAQEWWGVNRPAKPTTAPVEVQVTATVVD